MSFGDRKNIHFRTIYIGTFKPDCWSQTTGAFRGNVANEERVTQCNSQMHPGVWKANKKGNYLFIWGI